MYPQCSDSVGSVRNAMVTPHRVVSHQSAAFLQGDSAVLQLLTNHARVLLHNPGLHPHTPHTHAGNLNISEMKNIFVCEADLEVLMLSVRSFVRGHVENSD